MESVVAALWLAVGASAMALVGRLVAQGGRLLLAQEARVKNAELRDALEFATNEAERAAEAIVTGLNQEVVGQLKADGRWNAQAAKAVKDKAVELVRAALSDEGKAALKHAVGDLETYLSTLIEAKVAVAPNRTAAGGRRGVTAVRAVAAR